jgi:hypothetical protein
MRDQLRNEVGGHLDGHFENRLPQGFSLGINPQGSTPPAGKDTFQDEIDAFHLGEDMMADAGRPEGSEVGEDSLGGQLVA